MNNFRVWHLPAAWKHATVYKLQFQFLSQSQCQSQSQSLCHKLSWHFPHLAASFNLKSVSMSFDWNVPRAHAHSHAPVVNHTQIDDHLELKMCHFLVWKLSWGIDDRANRSPHQSMQQVRAKMVCHKNGIYGKLVQQSSAALLWHNRASHTACILLCESSLAGMRPQTWKLSECNFLPPCLGFFYSKRVPITWVKYPYALSQLWFNPDLPL